MRHLTVTKFSAIARASIDLAPVTILIGAQGSGKSVLSKLAFFFHQIFSDLVSWAEDDKDIDDARELLGEKFDEWFPCSAWGSRKFAIEYTMGTLTFKCARVSYAGKVADRVRFTIPSSIADLYEQLRSGIKLAQPQDDGLFGTNAGQHRARMLWRNRITELAGEDYIAGQVFVPAGRSFFTSMGKTVVAFEQVKLLDWLTTAFGQRFMGLRDRGGFRLLGSKAVGDNAVLISCLQEIFGGQVTRERGKELVITADGRRVPFGALSSGQQELLPLLVVVSSFFEIKTPTMGSRTPQAVYIEEPEAHLFPTAQSKLVEILAALCNQRTTPVQMLLTTHSPYVVAKLNNLIKAGSIASAKSSDVQGKVSAIIPRHAWLAPGTVAAYALEDGNTESLIGDDGLVVADYLDGVSASISQEFSSLLEIEYAP